MAHFSITKRLFVYCWPTLSFLLCRENLPLTTIILTPLVMKPLFCSVASISLIALTGSRSVLDTVLRCLRASADSENCVEVLSITLLATSLPRWSLPSFVSYSLYNSDDEGISSRVGSCYETVSHI